MRLNTKYSIFFLLPSLRGGGAERVTLHLLAGLDRRLFSPALIMAQREGPYLEAIPPDVEVIALNRGRMRYTLIDLIRILRRRQPDILFSAMSHTNTIALLAKGLIRPATRFIVSEHNTLSLAIQTQSFKRLRVALLRYLYRRADAVVAVSQGVAEDLSRVLNLPRQKVTTIYNPVVELSFIDKAEETVDHPWFAYDRRVPVVLGCGRLSKQKGFAYLIQAMACLQHKMAARLVILGKGEQEPALKQLARDLDIQDKVAFLGFQPNPYKFMARADVCVLSSLWEGLPTVLIEAMACGTPVVSTDCPSGPSEIITHEINGLLVPPADAEALAAAILRVLKDKELAQRLSRNGRARAEAFRVEKIVQQYEELFLRIAGNKPYVDR